MQIRWRISRNAGSRCLARAAHLSHIAAVTSGASQRVLYTLGPSFLFKWLLVVVLSTMAMIWNCSPIRFHMCNPSAAHSRANPQVPASAKLRLHRSCCTIR